MSYYPTLTILGIDDVKRLRNPKVDFMVSILAADDLLFPPAWVVRDRYLALTFADIDDPQVTSGIHVPPSREDVRTILAFGRKVIEAQREQEAPVSMLIHCTAGVSRSTAAAYAIWCDWLGPGMEAEAAAAVLAVRPQATPNRLMVAYADELLERQGRMIEAAGVFYRKGYD